MHPTHDHDRPMNETDRTTETRFGPRPVPQGHMSHPASGSRRVIPSGRVSPDGRSAYPTPALGSKIAVWGGVALGVAGGTAAAVFAIRKIAEAIADDPHPHRSGRPTAAPRFASLDDDAQEAMRQRVRAQDRADRAEMARLRADAAVSRPQMRAPRKPRGNFVEDLIQTSDKLSESLQSLAKSLSVAVESFRGVAAQATGIVSEFASAADELRSALRGGATPRAQPDPRDRQADLRDRQEHDRTHRL